MTSCPVCLNKDAETLEAIKSAYLDEGASAEEISSEFSIPYDLIMEHLSKCITSGENKIDGMNDRSEDLQEVYRKVKEALDEAHITYMADSKGSNAQGYSQILMQFRGLVQDIHQLDSPEKLASELANDVVGPLVSRVITTVTEELHRLREDLTPKVGAEHSKAVSNASSDMLKRIGSRLTMDQQEAVIKIQKRFNVVGDDEGSKKKKPYKSDAALH